MTAPFYRRLSTGAHMFMHPCIICEDPIAPFGFDVELRKGKPGRWYCAKHKERANDKAEHESRSGRTEARIADAPAPLSAMGEARPDDGRAEGPQGKLFD